MSAPVNREEFFDLIRRSGVLEPEKLDSFARSASDSGSALDQPQAIAGRMVHDGLLTVFQAKQLLQGKWRRFLINNKYKLLELIGAGGMGAVYLCEHIFMRRLVALKVLPVDKLDDPSAVERFYREARAAGALDHPNIVRAHDIDKDDKLHFLVMEYVDGSSLQEIVAQHGPMDPVRAAHYIRQASFGLQHAHEAGLVHRDIKPGNLLLDRTGTIKLLDLGLARFFNAHKDNVTEKYDDKAILGTADYLAPEQAMGSAVDIRADIYGLGGTYYFLLTGKAPFEDGTITQKLLWHQTRAPKSIRELRPEVPEGMIAILERMIAKSSDDRYQTPNEVAEALKPWTDQPIPPPTEAEMPRRSPACLTPGAQGMAVLPSLPLSKTEPSNIFDREINQPSTNASRSPTRPAAVKTPPRIAPNPVVAVARKRVTIAPAPKSAPAAVQVRPKKAVQAHTELSPRTLILAAVGGAGAVALFGGVIWWAFSGGGEKPAAKQPAVKQPAAKQPQPSQPSSIGVAHAAKTTAVGPAGVVPPEKAGQFLNQRCTVEMTVRYVGKAATADRYFLNSKVNYRESDNFTITFTKPVIDQLKAKGITDIAAHFERRTIRVTGKVTEFQMRPQIEIDDLDKIQLVNPGA